MACKNGQITFPSSFGCMEDEPGETVKEYYDRFFKTFVHCPYNFDEEDVIRVYWNGLSDFEKQQGAYRTYEPAPGITYDEFMRDI